MQRKKEKKKRMIIPPFFFFFKPFQTSQLLNELLRIFSPDEITANIGLLSHSVAHVKIRVAELKALNKSYDISPKVLDMSDRNFERFLKRVKDN